MVRLAALVVVTYSVYMICHVIQGSLVPDGLILSAIIGVIAAFAGIKLERNMIYTPEQQERITEGHEDR